MIIKKAKDLKPEDYLCGYGAVISVRVGWLEVRVVSLLENSTRGHIRRFSRNEKIGILDPHEDLSRDRHERWPG